MPKRSRKVHTAIENLGPWAKKQKTLDKENKVRLLKLLTSWMNTEHSSGEGCSRSYFEHSVVLPGRLGVDSSITLRNKRSPTASEFTRTTRGDSSPTLTCYTLV
jgi:hypothetical protein